MNRLRLSLYFLTLLLAGAPITGYPGELFPTSTMRPRVRQRRVRKPGIVRRVVRNVSDTVSNVQQTCKKTVTWVQQHPKEALMLLERLVWLYRQFLAGGADQHPGNRTTPVFNHTAIAQELERERALERIRLQDGECLVCLDDKQANEFRILSCRHHCCAVCLNTIVDGALQEQNMNQLLCPDATCRRQMTESDLRRIVGDDHERFNACCNLMAREWLLRQPNARHCPTPDCQHIHVNNAQQFRTVRCPDCRQEYCSNCTRAHTVGIRCQEAPRTWREELNERWREGNTKPCPECGVDIQKNGGCNAMTCTRCHHHFCWICLEPDPYGHTECARINLGN